MAPLPYQITVSIGPKDNVRGAPVPVDLSDPVASLVRVLAETPTSREAWWSPHRWQGDARSQGAGWLGAIAVVLDVDYVSAGGEHAMPSHEDAERFRAAVGSAPGTHWHPTPRGTRLVALLDEPVADLEAWKQAARGYASEVASWLRRNRLDCDRSAHLPGYEIDDGVVCDAKRFLYGPRALVSGIQRSAVVSPLRSAPYSLSDLVALLPAPAPTPAAARPKGPAVLRAPRAFARFSDAAENYNRDHTRDWGKPGAGECPACRHKGCFGRMKGREERWACFSTNHVDGCGTRGEQATTGDALDLDAYLAGRDPASHLRAEGYLVDRSTSTSAPAFEEPPPPSDDDAPPFFDDVEGDLGATPRPAPALRVVPPQGEDPRPSSPSASPSRADDLPNIRIGTDEERVNDAAIAALSKDLRVFQRGRSLVQVLRGITVLRGVSRTPDALSIAEIPLARLRELMAANARWLAFDGKAAAAAAKARAAVDAATGTDGGEAPAAPEVEAAPVKAPKYKVSHPPDWSVRAVFARGRWEGVRPLVGVTEWPVLRSDGTILADPGYDARTGLFYEPAGGVDAIPQEPSSEEVAGSLSALREAVCDFPFEDAAGFSAWLAALLTPLARYAFDGPAPLFLAEANTPGSGKTLLWELVSTILCGRPLASTPYAEKDEEMAKKITSCAMAGDAMIFLDNIRDTFGGGALDQALTGRSWRDRILGRSENTAELPLNATWFATGNNLRYIGDIHRRLCVCRLESPWEKPEEREAFRHPDLLAWARQERRRLLSSCLLILRAFQVAGAPRGTWTLWGSYEGWSRTVKACIEWLGLPPPPNPSSAGAQTTEQEELAIVLEAWSRLDPEGHGITAAQLVREIETERARAKRDGTPVDETVQGFVDGLGEAILNSPRKLGHRLRRWKGRVHAGRSLQAAGVDRLGGQRWAVKWAEGFRPAEPEIAPEPRQMGLDEAWGSESDAPTDPRLPD